MYMMKKYDEAIIKKFMSKLGLTREEAIELYEADKEVDKMTVSEANGEFKSVSKTQKTDGVAAKKKVTKDANGFTPNQAKALEILGATKEFMTAKQISEASDGMLNSRGLGAVMRTLVDKGLVEKQAGSPVQYKIAE